MDPDTSFAAPSATPSHARALWQTGPGQAELRDTPLQAQGADVVIEMLFTGISRGTESLVLSGAVPAAEAGRMRAPLQEGDFPFPVKYGYCAVGRIAAGPAAPLDRRPDMAPGLPVFFLGPHQTVVACPVDLVHPLPEGLPPARAILAANMETALTIVWDSGAGPADRVAVVGAGVVGALVAWLCARIPGTEVTLIDTNPERATVAAALGCGFALPDAAPSVAGGADVVVHASASAAGLALALGLAGREAVVVEASWHGAEPVPVPLGHAFHSQRLRLLSSQVGQVPASRAPRWSHARRMQAALRLLCDPALDVLISGETPFDHLAEAYPHILAAPETLCHRVRYA